MKRFIPIALLFILACPLAHADWFAPVCGAEAYESLIMQYIVKYGGVCWPLDDAPEAASIRELTGVYPGTPSATGLTLHSAGPIVSGETAMVAAFNGAAGCVTRAYSSTFDGAAVSVATWVKVSGGVWTFRAIMNFGKSTTPKGGWALLINSLNTFRFYAFNSAQVLIGSSTAAYTLDTWTHVCGVWDGTNLHLYVNGAEVMPAVAMTGHPVNPSMDLTIGSTETTQYFNGSLAYPMVIGGTALTANEVLSLYNAAVKGL
jgi:hypothetical protein